MPNGNQQEQFLFEDWGWKPPDISELSREKTFNPDDFHSAMQDIATETEQKLKQYYETDNVKVILGEVGRDAKTQGKYLESGASRTPLSLHQLGAGADFTIVVNNRVVKGTGKDKSLSESVDPYRILGGVAKDKGFFWGINWDSRHVGQSRYVDEFIKENPQYASSDVVRSFYGKYNKEAPANLKPVLTQLDNIYKSKSKREYYGEERTDEKLLTPLNIADKQPTQPWRVLEQPTAQPPPPTYQFQDWGWDVPGQPESQEAIASKNKKIEDLHEPIAQAGGGQAGRAVLGKFFMRNDMVNSEYMMLKKAMEEGDEFAKTQIEAMDMEIERLESFGEGAQYAMKRVASWVPGISLIPGTAEYINWQKHRRTPIQFRRSADPDSPGYDPMEGAGGIPIGYGQTVGVQDLTDVMSIAGEFAIIGNLTKVPFEAALKASKSGKLTSGAYRLFTKNKNMIPVLKHVAKANLDFGIHNFTSMHEVDLDENSTFGKKLRDRFEKMDDTAVTASLFGMFGSLQGVVKQYGGVFAAGYTTAMLAAVKDEKDPKTGEIIRPGLSPSEAHGEAFKSGMMLMGVHAVNALGMQAGKRKFIKRAKELGMSEESARTLAEQIVMKKISDEKPLFKSAEKDPTVVEIVGETKVGNQRAFIIKDVQSDDPHPKPIRVNDFYKYYEKTNHPKKAEQIRKGRLGKIHSLQNQLKMTDEQQYIFKRSILGVKGKVSAVKEGELPFYVDLESKTAGQLKLLADQFGLEYNTIDNKAKMLKIIEEGVPRAKGEYLSWSDANPRQLFEAQTTLDIGLQIQKRTLDVQKGLYSKDLESDGNKIFKPLTSIFGKAKLKPPTDTEIHAERLITDYEGTIQNGLLDTQNKVKDFNTIYIQDEVTPEMSRRVVMAKAGELDPTNLSPVETKLLELYTKTTEQGAITALEEGVMEDVIDNYFTGLYPDMSPKKLQIIKSKSKVSGKTPYSKQKLFLLPSEAEAAGLKPIYDLRELTGHWWDSVNRAVANKTMLERLGNLPTQDGELAITPEFIPGYIKIDWSPALSKVIAGSIGKSVYAHPTLAPQLKILLNPAQPDAAKNNALKTLHNGVKRVIMINPLIHGWNIYSDVMDEYSFRMLKTGRVVLAGEKPWLLAKRTGYVESKAEWNEMTKDRQVVINRQILSEMASQGIGIAETQSLTIELGNFYRKNFSELSVSDATFSKKLKYFGKKMKKNPLRTLRMASDNFLWDKIVKNSQISIYALTKSRAIKSGLSEVEARRVAGHYTKDLLGMLSKSVFSPDGAFSGDKLNYLFFARNWTISNLRLVSGATGYRGNNLPRFLAHKGISKPEAKFLQEQYTAHLIKGAIGSMVLTNLLNYAFTGIEPEFEEGKLVGFNFNKEKAHWATENEEGHELDIDTGTYNSTGGKIYVENLLFRYIRDYEKWATDPAKTFLNKVHPVPKAAVEQIINMTLWNNRKIIPYPNQSDMWEKARLRTQHLLYSITPYGQFAGQPDRVRTWVEKIAPLFGTWTKSGVAGGDAIAKLNRFIEERNYKFDEIDTHINLMWQTGDETYVVSELAKLKRYRDIDGIKNRMLKYRNYPLWRFNVVLRSKADRKEFMSTLTKREREEFIAAMKIGNPRVKAKIPN